MAMLILLLLYCQVQHIPKCDQPSSVSGRNEHSKNVLQLLCAFFIKELETFFVVLFFEGLRGLWFCLEFGWFGFFLEQDVCGAVSASFKLPGSVTASGILATWSLAGWILIQSVC